MPVTRKLTKIMPTKLSAKCQKVLLKTVFTVVDYNRLAISLFKASTRGVLPSFSASSRASL
jgi:hypothetical protein